MPAAFALFKFVAKAALSAVGAGIISDFAVDVLPEIARDVWQWWGKDRPTEQLQQELEQVAQLSPVEVARQAEQAVAEAAAGRPETERIALTAYLSLIPSSIRQSQRRLSDPTGRTMSRGLSLVKSESLLPLLPARFPRFKPDDRPPGIGDWELVELLGAGGFGEVWKARNPHLPEPVALKFCLDPSAAAVLRNEAALLGRVMSQGRHPGIVQLRHTYLKADTPCLEYEYVAGGDLCAIIRDARPGGGLPPRQAARIVQEVAEAVGFAHRLVPSIVHRDLKPANILVQRSVDGKLAFRVADFGIGGVAAAQAIGQTRLGATRGQLLVSSLRGSYTPLYASPQQVQGDPPDPRDDVYSLGVIWHQLLTGEVVAGAPVGGAWKKHLAEKGTPAHLVDLLEECINYRPADRPANAAVLAERIAAIIDKKPSDGHPTKIPSSEFEQDMKEALEVLRTKGDNRTYFERQGPTRIGVWQAAAQQGDAIAQWLLSRCLQERTGAAKDAQAGVSWLRRAAESGLAVAQTDLGDCYYLGEGVKADSSEAFRLYTKAAEQGFTEAQVDLGDCFYEGKGVEKDFVEAARYYRMGAEAGWARGQDSLGDCFYAGCGVEQDYPQAIGWYRKAADQGLASAQFNLGWCYQYGRGVKKNWGEAAKWYRKAAEQDSDEAQFALGCCYQHGHGVEPDIAQAEQWYRKAADQGHRRAKNALRRLQENDASDSDPGEEDEDDADTTGYWVIAPYSADPPEEWQKVWEFDLANNIISIGWRELGDISALDEQSLRAAIDRTYPDTSTIGKGQYFGMLWNFYHEIKLGDVILARRGLKKLAAVGTVIRTAYHDPNKNLSAVGGWFTFANHLDVQWDDYPRDKEFDDQVFGMLTVYQIPEEKFHTLVDSSRGRSAKGAAAVVLSFLSEIPRTEQELIRLAQEHALEALGKTRYATNDRCGCPALHRLVKEGKVKLTKQGNVNLYSVIDWNRYLIRIEQLQKRRGSGSYENLTPRQKKLHDTLKGMGNGVVHTRDIKGKFDIDRETWPTDFCYNRVNLEDNDNKFLYRCGPGKFQFVGFNWTSKNDEIVTWTLRPRRHDVERNTVSQDVELGRFEVGIYGNNSFRWTFETLLKVVTKRMQ